MQNKSFDDLKKEAKNIALDRTAFHDHLKRQAAYIQSVLDPVRHEANQVRQNARAKAVKIREEVTWLIETYLVTPAQKNDNISPQPALKKVLLQHDKKSPNGRRRNKAYRRLYMSAQHAFKARKRAENDKKRSDAWEKMREAKKHLILPFSMMPVETYEDYVNYIEDQHRHLEWEKYISGGFDDIEVLLAQRIQEIRQKAHDDAKAIEQEALSEVVLVREQLQRLGKMPK